MASFYEMPAISPTMELGILIEWKVKEGDVVTPQTVVAEIGTDKANMEAEVFDDGVILKLLVEEDDEIPPGYPILIWGKSKDEDISELIAEFEKMSKDAAKKPEDKPKSADDGPPEKAVDDDGAADDAATDDEVDSMPDAAPAAEGAAAEPTARAASLQRTWNGKKLPHYFFEPLSDARIVGSSATEGSKKAGGQRIIASPLAKAIAKDKGIDLSTLTGSGPGGRIVKADVEDAKTAPTTAPQAAGRDDVVIKNTPMRKTIAKRLLQSHQDIPVFFLTAELDVGNLVAFREQLKAALDQKISYNDLIIAAVGRALRAVPAANASWTDKSITRHGRVDVGMAVAVEGGLITPVIRNADTKPLDQIARETRELAGRAREQKLSTDEYTGGTFSVSNLGMMGIKQFTAIINPPESAILAVGAMDQRPVVVNGELTTGWRLDVTLSCDHRVLDGSVGATFLEALRRYLENPVLLATGA